jgi:hypothetical protein
LTEFKVFNAEAVAVFECVIKHWSEARELLSEHNTTITSPQVCENNNNGDLFMKLLHISSTKGDVEELAEEFFNQFLVEDVAVATQMRVSKEDIAQMIQVIGHLACGEEHLDDYIKKYTGTLQTAKLDEQPLIKKKIEKLNDFLYTTRLIRKKYLTGFLQKLEEKVEKVSMPEASDFKANV